MTTTENGVKKIAMFVFNGDSMCFIHVLLNALDMFESDYETRIVIEGAATKLIPVMAKESNPLFPLWEKAKNFQLIDGVCKACSTKNRTLIAAENQGLALLDELHGHPSIARYRDAGYEVMIF